MKLDPAQHALIDLGRILKADGYRFVTPTPATHGRVNARPRPERSSLVDVFGWSRPFRSGMLPATVECLLTAADMVTAENGWLSSKVRYSTLQDDIYVHSAHPTNAPNAVFFGPDSYRFAAFANRVLPVKTGRTVDVGAGSGVGGLSLRARASSLVLTDINPLALRYAEVNVRLNGASAECLHSDILGGVDGELDTVVANPPYLVDEAERAYRHGGGARGTSLSMRIVTEALARLSPGGILVLYTATPVVDGKHLLVDELAIDAPHAWEELDPDVFGDALDEPAYADVDRIALMGLVARKPSDGRTDHAAISG